MKSYIAPYINASTLMISAVSCMHHQATPLIALKCLIHNNTDANHYLTTTTKFASHILFSVFINSNIIHLVVQNINQEPIHSSSSLLSRSIWGQSPLNQASSASSEFIPSPSLKKLKIELPFNLAAPLLGRYTKALKLESSRGMCTPCSPWPFSQYLRCGNSLIAIDDITVQQIFRIY